MSNTLVAGISEEEFEYELDQAHAALDRDDAQTAAAILLVVLPKLENPEDRLHVLGLLGVSQRACGLLDDSFETFEVATLLASSMTGNEDGALYADAAETAIALCLWDKARDWLHQSITQSKDFESMAESFLALAEVHLALDDFEEARIVCDRILNDEELWKTLAKEDLACLLEFRAEALFGEANDWDKTSSSFQEAAKAYKEVEDFAAAARLYARDLMVCERLDNRELFEEKAAQYLEQIAPEMRPSLEVEVARLRELF